MKTQRNVMVLLLVATLATAQVEFVKNEKGEVTHMVLHQNGRDTKGVKK